MEGDALQVYAGILTATEKISNELDVLVKHSKQITEYNMTLETLNTSFDKVQSKLVRVAAIRPEFSKISL